MNNFNYMDKDASYELPPCPDLESALQACMKIVDDYLLAVLKPGMLPGYLLEMYKTFGDDPYIVGAEDGVKFSAWEYAKARAEELCNS